MNTTTTLPLGENSEDTPHTMERVMSSTSCLKLDEEPSGNLSLMSSTTCLKLDEEGPGNLPLSKLTKRVSFDTIEILQFPIEVGDNPCAEGVPISIGWEAHETDVFDLDLYEQHKPEPRGRDDIHIPAQIRQALLAAEGTTAKEMLEAVTEAQKIQKSRVKSIRSQKWDGINYAMEMTSRRMRKVASLSSLSSSATTTSSFLPRRGSLQRMPVVLPGSSDFVAEVPAAVEEGTAGEVDDGPLSF
jgi:hypothetical protein